MGSTNYLARMPFTRVTCPQDSELLHDITCYWLLAPKVGVVVLLGAGGGLGVKPLVQTLGQGLMVKTQSQWLQIFPNEASESSRYILLLLRRSLIDLLSRKLT